MLLRTGLATAALTLLLANTASGDGTQRVVNERRVHAGRAFARCA